MPDPTPAFDDDAAYYRAILHDLIDRGADLARRIHETAIAATPEDRAGTDPTIAFDRVTRAVRRTIALARHIASDPAATTRHARTRTRTKLIRGVEDAIHRKRNETDAQSLYAELAERLEDPELELDLEGRPVDELIEEICRDLGVAVQGRSYVHKRRTPGDVAAMRARAAAPVAPAPSLHLIQGGRPAPLPPKPQPKPPLPPAGEGRGEGPSHPYPPTPQAPNPTPSPPRGREPG